MVLVLALVLAPESVSVLAPVLVLVLVPVLGHKLPEALPPVLKVGLKLLVSVSFSPLKFSLLKYTRLSVIILLTISPVKSANYFKIIVTKRRVVATHYPVTGASLYLAVPFF